MGCERNGGSVLVPRTAAIGRPGVSWCERSRWVDIPGGVGPYDEGERSGWIGTEGAAGLGSAGPGPHEPSAGA